MMAALGHVVQKGQDSGPNRGASVGHRGGLWPAAHRHGMVATCVAAAN